MKPTAVTWAVLGLIALGPRSGYDVKRIVDSAVRHFWAASYGQIYPELKRLEEVGWIEGADAPRGGRVRRVYRITVEGQRALDAWLRRLETRVELRDESLLRLFFADTMPHEDALALLRGRREGFRRQVAYMRSMDVQGNPPFVDLVYQWGLEYCEWNVEWCNRQEQRLRKLLEAA